MFVTVAMDSARSFNVHTKDNEVVKYEKPGKRMSVKEFEEWLENLDKNGDGVISKVELEEALKSIGLKFTNWKAKQAMSSVDANNNGFIDTDVELKEVIEYAQKHWGLTIYQDDD